MKITLDAGAKMPEKAHMLDAGYDLVAREGGLIPPFGGYRIFDTGVHAAVPEGCMGQIRSRSGLMFQHQVIAGEGTVDCGYTGSIRVILFNLGDFTYSVQPGDKIAQLCVVPCLMLPLEQTESLEASERGNADFGSTGR